MGGNDGKAALILPLLFYMYSSAVLVAMHGGVSEDAHPVLFKFGSPRYINLKAFVVSTRFTGSCPLSAITY